MASLQETERRIPPSLLQVAKRTLADFLDIPSLVERWIEQDAIYWNMNRLIKAIDHGGSSFKISPPLENDDLPKPIRLFLFREASQQATIEVTGKSDRLLGRSSDDNKELTLTVGRREVFFRIDIGRGTDFVPFTFRLSCGLHEMDEGWYVNRMVRGPFIQGGRVPQESFVDRSIVGELQGLPSRRVIRMADQVVNFITNRVPPTPDV